MTSTGHDGESPEIRRLPTLLVTDLKSEEDPDVCEAMPGVNVEAWQEVAADKERVHPSHPGVTRSDIEDVQGKRADNRSR